MSRFPVVIAVTLLTACGTTYYEKPGGTDEELQRALAGCRAQEAFIPATPMQPAPMNNPPTMSGYTAQGSAALANAFSSLGDALGRIAFIENCMRAQGWVAQRTKAPPSSPTTGTAESAPVAALYTPSSPMTIAAFDGSFRITLPAGWIEKARPGDNTIQLAATNRELDAYMSVKSYNAAGIPNWREFAEAIRKDALVKLANAQASELRHIKVNAYDAVQGELSGIVNGINIRILGTLIKTDKKIVIIDSLCNESRFAANRSKFEALPFGLQVSQ